MHMEEIKNYSSVIPAVNQIEVWSYLLYWFYWWIDITRCHFSFIRGANKSPSLTTASPKALPSRLIHRWFETQRRRTHISVILLLNITLPQLKFWSDGHCSVDLFHCLRAIIWRDWRKILTSGTLCWTMRIWRFWTHWTKAWMERWYHNTPNAHKHQGLYQC